MLDYTIISNLFHWRDENQNDLTSKKLNKNCTALNYIEHLLILTFAVTGCISVSVVVSLVGIPIPNRHTTWNRCRFGVDITPIRQRPNFDEFSPNFVDPRIHVVSTYFFWYNFTGRKIHVVSTNFFKHYIIGRNIHVFSTRFFRCNFDGWEIHDFSRYFFSM